MIAIVDYDVGNVASVANMLEHIGEYGAVVTRDAAVIADADKIILPGVGAFEMGMANLHKFGLIEALNLAVIDKGAPTLGICLGMQLLTRSSEEGRVAGLGWLNAETVRFSFDPESELKVPHIGWDSVLAARQNPLIDSEMPSRFYFVHAFHVRCADDADVIATTDYGGTFTSAVNRANIFGVQFHPEKSHRYGMALLRRFVSL